MSYSFTSGLFMGQKFRQFVPSLYRAAMTVCTVAGINGCTGRLWVKAMHG